MYSALAVNIHICNTFHNLMVLECSQLHSDYKEKKEGKDQGSILQVPHLAQDTVWESDKTQENVT